MAHKHWEQNKDATVYIGNIDERATDALIYELMLQAGPVVNVHLPKDRVTQSHQGFGFVEFNSEQDADYAAKIMNGIRLYTKPLRVNMASADKQKAPEIGAELFVGNLDSLVDEKVLYDTFSRFGGLVSAPKIARDENGASKGYGFVSYTDFDASDEAISNMNGQYLMSKEVSVQYAYKKDGKGERHGDEAERKLAAQAKKHNIVPETQALPPALMMNNAPPTGPAAMANPSPTLTGPGANGGPSLVPGAPQAQQPPVVPTTPPTMPPVAPPAIPAAVAAGAPPPGFGAPPQGAPPRFTGPPASNTPPGPSRSSPLPPPPSGLPPRPPLSKGGYGGPADFRPPGQAQGYRPPPAAPSGFGNLPAPPPSGFSPGGPPGGPPGPPPGSGAGSPPGAPPPGFNNMPPPGFPSGAPPPGFPRR
ncbi:Splicing factor 3B subunit 4 [Zalerion maritima]|uniref:Splicing factor 3B subunit 4 n=1 Tax=Zalerion maritima TaxID=339359 RepID=A0AAD5RY82_9PEZI|nr:Splicing factor 3B subunit 4 [Zalerion maritima]